MEPEKISDTRYEKNIAHKYSLYDYKLHLTLPNEIIDKFIKRNLKPISTKIFPRLEKISISTHKENPKDIKITKQGISKLILEFKNLKYISIEGTCNEEFISYLHKDPEETENMEKIFDIRKITTFFLPLNITNKHFEEMKEELDNLAERMPNLKQIEFNKTMQDNIPNQVISYIIYRFKKLETVVCQEEYKISNFHVFSMTYEMTSDQIDNLIRRIPYIKTFHISKVNYDTKIIIDRLLIKCEHLEKISISSTCNEKLISSYLHQNPDEGNNGKKIYHIKNIDTLILSFDIIDLLDLERIKKIFNDKSKRMPNIVEIVLNITLAGGKFPLENTFNNLITAKEISDKTINLNYLEVQFIARAISHIIIAFKKLKIVTIERNLTKYLIEDIQALTLPLEVTNEELNDLKDRIPNIQIIHLPNIGNDSTQPITTNLITRYELITNLIILWKSLKRIVLIDKKQNDIFPLSNKFKESDKLKIYEIKDITSLILPSEITEEQLSYISKSMPNITSLILSPKATKEQLSYISNNMPNITFFILPQKVTMGGLSCIIKGIPLQQVCHQDLPAPSTLLSINSIVRSDYGKEK